MNTIDFWKVEINLELDTISNYVDIYSAIYNIDFNCGVYP
jgi:hypothetical protein